MINGMSRKQKAPIGEPTWDDPAPDDVPSRQIGDDSQVPAADSLTDLAGPAASKRGTPSTAEAMPALAAFDAPTFFGPSGPLAAQMYGYEQRPSQVEMAAGVRQAILEHKHALIEAPTGTGKSIAYLVPAILSGKTVVVSTANKSLQSQLFQKDIPFLRQVLGREIRAVLVKGRSNYVCNLKWEKELAEQKYISLYDREDDQVKFMRTWLDETETGDVDELPFVLGSDLRPRVVSFPDDCLHGDCRHDEDNCWVNFMRDAAAEAQVIITNHHLLLNALELGFAGERILPPASVYVDRRSAPPGADRHRRLRDSRHRLYCRTVADPYHPQGACARRRDRATALSQYAGLPGGLEPKP